MNAPAVRECANDLPRDPGVYQFRRDDTTLYVGKAVDLRDRVRSYADPRSQRIARMVERADDVEVAVTDTETQALLLEANLIKRHQPRYNVRLKDDKSYPLVQLTDHAVPQIEVTRDPAEDAVAYGPFTDKGRVETVVKALRETYCVRGCSDHKYANRDRPCLDYEVGLCTAPCTGEISEDAYADDVASVRRFFEGETGVLSDPLRGEMERAAENREFERAANLRDRLDVVESFHGGGGEAVSSQDGVHADEQSSSSNQNAERFDDAVDVLGVAIEGDDATVARLHSEGGQLVDRERHRLAVPEGDEGEVSDGSDETEARRADRSGGARVITAFLTQYYAERDLPDAILLPEHHGDDEVDAWLDAEGVAVRVPGAGREGKLVELALKNARRRGGDRDETRALADELGIDRADRIEGFDVSHAQGSAVVGSNVAFVDGDPAKADYRRKKLAERNDDYANMRALVRWRAERAVEDRDVRPDPDLLLIDGGEGQLGAARDVLAETGWDVPVVALAKSEEAVVTPSGGPASGASGTSSRGNRSYGVHDWPQDAPHLHLLQRVRDEAHRFAVQYHQTVRDDVSTVLDDVPGVGPETRKRLLRRFGSVENVRAASPDQLRTVDGVGEKTVETLASRL